MHGMNLSDFINSADAGGDPPELLSDALKAMWLLRGGNWQQAHDLCGALDDSDSAWVHAHLHRIEGDLGNAGYWYSMAGKAPPQGMEGLEEEWMAMVGAMLGDRQKAE